MKIPGTYANLYPSTRKPRVDGARLGWPWMNWSKSFEILIGS